MLDVPLLPLSMLVFGATATAQVVAPYDAPVVVADEDQEIVRTLDLNGDGWEDAVGWWFSDTPPPFGNPTGKMCGWLNDGTGRLVEAWEVSLTVDHAYPIQREICDVADLDGDGDDDWVILDDNEFHVYLSNGAAPPTNAINVFSAHSFKSVVLDDFDGDGTMELAASASSRLVLYDLSFNPPAAVQVSQRAHAIADPKGPLLSADLNGDSTPDLLLDGCMMFPVTDASIGPMAWNYLLPADPATHQFMHDVGDVDGDGDLDIVTFAMSTVGGPNLVRVLLWDGAFWSFAPPYVGGPARVLGDVDGDGDLDAACCSSGGGDGTANTSASTFRVSLNDGTGQFAPAIEWPGLGSRALAGIVDLDHDGDMDLVAGRAVHYAQGPIAAQPMVDPGDAFERAPWIGDADGDGDLDLDLHLGGYRANLGDGTFEARSLTLPPAPASLVRLGEGYVADWDGDGDPDLLAPLRGASGQVGMELLVNTAPGRFESAGIVNDTHIPSASGARDRALSGDLDGDGDLDLIVRSEPYAGTTANHVFLNLGVAGFQGIGSFGDVLVMEIADVDGDGTPDVLGALAPQPTNSPLMWAPGLGDGTFGPWVTLPGTFVRAYEDQFSVADLDANGEMDIAVFQTKSGDVHAALVLWNQGNGVFTPEVLGSVSYSTFAVNQMGIVAVDVQGNGTLDLLAGPIVATSNALDVLLRNQDGTGYLPPQPQVMLQPYPDQPWYSEIRMGLVVGDLDGDGDPEVVGARVTKDVQFHGPNSGSRVQLGDGVQGQGGVAPLLGAEGPFRVGETVQLRLCGLRPGASGVLSLVGTPSPLAAPFTGSVGRVSQAAFVQRIPFVASGANGDPIASGTWTHSFVVQPGMAGATWHYAAEIEDLDAVGGTSHSNLLVLTYGT